MFVINTNRVRFIDKIIFFVYQPRMIGNWNRLISQLLLKRSWYALQTDYGNSQEQVNNETH